MGLRIKAKMFQASYKLWRGQSWSRGYKAGLEAASEHDARNAAWVNFLERYYFEHQNHHLKDAK